MDGDLLDHIERWDNGSFKNNAHWDAVDGDSFMKFVFPCSVYIYRSLSVKKTDGSGKKINIYKYFLVSVFVFTLCVLVACASRDQGLKIFKVVIGDDVYLMPAGYILDYDQVNKGFLKGGNFHALYPGLEPKTEKNSDVFSRSGYGGGKKVLFSLKERGEGEISNPLIDKISKTSSVIAQYGLERHSYMSNKREYYLGSFEKHKIYISCNLDGDVVYPSCRSKINISDSSTIFMTFSKVSLGNWSDLFLETKEKILSLKVKG